LPPFNLNEIYINTKHLLSTIIKDYPKSLSKNKKTTTMMIVFAGLLV